MFYDWRSVPVGTSLGREPESRQRILAAGIPYVLGSSILEEATELLAGAGRVEHAMMVEYLRAAFAARDPKVAQVLTSLAGEELCHLLTVQNLRLMLAAEPSLERPAFLVAAASEPLPMSSGDFSLDSLARYACWEAPQLHQVPQELRSSFAKAGRMWSEAAVFVNRIGSLYAKIYWLFMNDDQDSEAWWDFPVDLLEQQDAGRHVNELDTTGQGRQLSSAEWPGVVACVTTSEARSALLEIAGQGEGGPTQVGSHFERLLEAYTVAEGHDAFHAINQPTTAVEPALDALYNVLTSELVLALAIDPDDPRESDARHELLASARADWTVLTGLAESGLRACPKLELKVPASGAVSACRRALELALDSLQRCLEPLLEAAASEGSSWISDLHRRSDGRRRLILGICTLG